MNINGITEIEKFLTCIAEMYLMVVSEKIINDIPEKKVTNFNLLYFKLSFDDNVNKSYTRTNNGM